MDRLTKTKVTLSYLAHTFLSVGATFLWGTHPDTLQVVFIMGAFGYGSIVATVWAIEAW